MGKQLIKINLYERKGLNFKYRGKEEEKGWDVRGGEEKANKRIIYNS